MKVEGVDIEAFVDINPEHNKDSDEFMLDLLGKIDPRQAVVIVDGILVLLDPEVNKGYAASIFVDADFGVRLARAIKRYQEEWQGSDVEGFINIFNERRITEDEWYVLPTKVAAGFVIDNSTQEIISTRAAELSEGDTHSAPDRVVAIPIEAAGFSQPINLGKVSIKEHLSDIEHLEGVRALQDSLGDIYFQGRLSQIMSYIYYHAGEIEINIVIEPAQINRPSMWFRRSTNSLHIQVLYFIESPDKSKDRILPLIPNDYAEFKFN